MTTDGTASIPMKINGDWLYASPDGREAWVLFNKTKGLAFISTDIHGMGQPYNAVGFTADILRAIADHLDQSSGSSDVKASTNMS